MKKKKRWMTVMAAVSLSCLLGTSMANAAEFPPNGGSQTSYSHGSETAVSESELKTTIPSEYDVNSATQAKAKEGAYAKLFDTKQMQTVNITVDEKNWNYLLQNANEKPYVLADGVSIGEESISYVGIKTKGNLTLNQVWQSDSDRFSFTVNVSKYIKKKAGYSATQNFYGLEKFSLNNVYGDASYLKEYLSYELMTAMGVPTPYYALVKLCINGQYWGVYCMVENVDESLVKRTVDSSADGDLYKNEAPGGDLLYNSTLDSYLSGESTYDFATYSEASNVLSGYTGILDNKEIGTTIEDYVTDLSATETEEEKEAVKTKYQETLTTDCNELFTWMKKLNELNTADDANQDTYQESLEEILDVDSALRYFAANTYLVNLDSYQSEKQQNYCIYLINGKAAIIPWDYNYSFGGYGVNNASEMINFNVDTPVIDVTLSERPLLNVLLQNDQYRAKYESYLNDCATIAINGGIVNGVTYEANHFNQELANYKENILAATLSETSAETPFYTYDQFKTAVDHLKLLITQRSLAVVNQIKDDFTTVDTAGADLTAIGNVTGGAGQGGPGGGQGQAPPSGMPELPDGERPSDAPVPPSGMPVPPSNTPAVPSTSPEATKTPEATTTPQATNTAQAVNVGQVKKLKASKTTKTTITLTWNKVSSATSYQVLKYDSGKKCYVVVATAKKNSMKIKGLQAGTTYKFKVRAINTTNKKNTYGAKSTALKVSTALKKPSLSLKKRTSTKVTLALNKVSGASNYVMYRSTSKTGAYKKVATIKASKTTYTQKVLKKNKTYYYKVRAYKIVNGKKVYSEYSSAVKASK